ncbi:MAG: TonB-dependent receptor, partial [Candidatus Eremiobacteraeota bacterium]|nr:TonB-dependent receptor [Candidatus Eremiobacteraeota bacterium]
GLELYHDNGSFDKPDRYAKVNGLLRWSRETANTLFNVTAWGYHGSFNSSDQIPARLVDAGVLDRYGAFDPSDGGSTYRYAVSSELVRTDARGTTRASAYVFAYGLQLFSNFEYDLNDASDFYNVTANPVTCNQLYAPCNAALHDYGGPRVGSATSTGSYTPYCPANAVPTGGATLPGSVPVSPSQFTFSCGDQREQLDRRVVSGFDVSRSFNDTGRVRTLAGLSVRNDAVGTVGLFLTHDRSRYPGGTLSDDSAVERDLAAYLQSEADLGTKLRITLGLRADLYHFAVHDAQPANSGRRRAGIVSPKFLAAYAFSRRQEAYLDVGESFHSNDARGVFQTLDPQTHAPFDPTGAPVQPVVPLVRAVGYEAGYRYAGTRFHAALSLWRLDLASELVFDGDHGTTAPAGPTRRKGIEVSTDYALNRFVTLDADVATSTAHFLSDADQQGIFVPESLNVVTSAGVTLDRPFYSASLHLRYFGPRTLDQSGTAVSAPSSLLNAQVTAKMRGGSALSLDVFNLLDARADDVEYYYNSWTPQDARNPAYASDPAINPALGGAGIPGYTFHPSQRRTVRLSYTTRLR